MGTRLRQFSTKRDCEISESLFMDDIEHIIRRFKRLGYDINEYEIQVNVREKCTESVPEDDETLFEIFETNPSNINNEKHLNQILTYMNHNDIILNDYIRNLFEVFITINYGGFPAEFELEHKLVDYTNISDMSNDDICNIINTELEWMGLGGIF